MSGLPFVLKAEFVGNGRGLFSAERDGLTKTQEKYVVGDEGDRYWFAKRLSENPELQNGDRVRIRDIVEELCCVEEQLRRSVRQAEITDAVDKTNQPVIQLICLGAVEPKDVEWLWRNRFPLGMMSVISGDPNGGKSTLVTDMASRISVGRPWPDLRDEPNPVGDVILLVGEDGIADTVRVRVDNAGGDPARIFVLNGVRHPESPEIVDPFSVERDLRHLDQLLQERPAVRMVAIDPLDIFLGAEVDCNRKSEVQRSLAGLTDLAERHRVAVVGVLHLRKSSGDKAIYRTLGSLGFVSAPRAAWMITRDKDDRSRRLMTCIKCNVAPDPTGLSFTIEDQEGVGVIHWQADPIEMTADEALNAEKPCGTTARDDAAEWLLGALALGPVDSLQLRKDAESDGISWRTLQRVKAEVGARARQRADGSRTNWYWELAPECQAQG